MDETAFMGFPAHHPAWPRWCDQCRQQAEGFNVSRRVGDGLALGTTGMACLPCRRAALPIPDVDKVIAQQALRMAECEAAVSGGFGRGLKLVWMTRADYQAKCCTAPAQP